MKLQILVPRYKESQAVLGVLLNSLAMQRGVNLQDISVLICNDGSKPLEQEFFDLYPFEINNLVKKHSGVSNTREALLKAATGDYVMFCDADDCFFSLHGLWIILNSIDQFKFDAMVSYYMEENIDSHGMVQYLTRGYDASFVHGKVYRREYLEDNNIHWVPDSNFNEDAPFNFLATHIPGANIVYTNFPFYLWTFNPSSESRLDVDADIHHYAEMIRNNDWLVNELKKRHIKEHALGITYNILFTTYYNFNIPKWKEERFEEDINEILRAFRHFVIENIDCILHKYTESEYRKVWEKIHDEAYNTLTNYNTASLATASYEDFDNWFNSLFNNEIFRGEKHEISNTDTQTQ